MSKGGVRPATTRRRSPHPRSSRRRPIRRPSGSRSASSSSGPGRPGSPARSGSGSCSRSRPTRPSGSARCRSPWSRKRSGPGSHLLSGAVMSPRAIRRLFRDRLTMDDVPSYGEVHGEAVPAHEGNDGADSAAADDAQPRHQRRLRLAARPSPSTRRRPSAPPSCRRRTRRSCSSPTGASRESARATRVSAATAGRSVRTSPAPTSSRR